MRFSRALLLLICSGLAACVTSPQDTRQDERTSSLPVVSEGSVSPNPYLLNRVAVPAAAQKQFQQGLDAMRQQQWQKAEPLLQELTVNYPQLSGPWLNLGLLYGRTSRLPEAEAAMQKALAVNPGNGLAYTQLAQLYRQQGRFVEAEQQYLAALDSWPDNADAHRDLGILYELYMGRLADALQHYQLAAVSYPQQDQQLQGWIIDLQRRLKVSEQ